MPHPLQETSAVGVDPAAGKTSRELLYTISVLHGHFSFGLRHASETFCGFVLARCFAEAQKVQSCSSLDAAGLDLQSDRSP